MDWLNPIREFIESALPLLDRLSFVRALLGFILVFFLPGFAWTLVFFRQINILERLVLSIGLSIAVVVLSILALNKLIGVRITGFNSLLIIIFVTVVPVVFYYLKRYIKRFTGSRSSSEG